jgi:hypothetical protein
MKNIFKISIVISMLIILIVTSSQSAFAAGNAKQVRLKVNGVYAIVSMLVTINRVIGQIGHLEDIFIIRTQILRLIRIFANTQATQTDVQQK